jgi:hypothetical protein
MKKTIKLFTNVIKIVKNGHVDNKLDKTSHVKKQL